MFVKLSIVFVALALANLAEGTPTCAQITSMTTVIKTTLAGTTTTGNLASKALRLGLPLVIFIVNCYCEIFLMVLYRIIRNGKKSIECYFLRNKQLFGLIKIIIFATKNYRTVKLF